MTPQKKPVNTDFFIQLFKIIYNFGSRICIKLELA